MSKVVIRDDIVSPPSKFGVTYGNLRFYLARDVTKDRTVTKLAIANIEVIRYAQVTQV